MAADSGDVDRIVEVPGSSSVEGGEEEVGELVDADVVSRLVTYLNDVQLVTDYEWSGLYRNP